MIIIDDILVAEDVYKADFVCNLSKCKGACCVEGDYGAPLDPEELQTINSILDHILPLLPEESRDVILSKGFHQWFDKPGLRGTRLHPDGACVFMIRGGDGIAKCGIEAAHEAGEVTFRKPISCHLYPVRVRKNEGVGFEALNYDRWDICSPACTLGAELKVPVYKFVKGGLVRKYGLEFYEQLDEAVEHIGRIEEKKKRS